MKRIGIGSMGAIGGVHAVAALAIIAKRAGWGLAYSSSNADVRNGLWSMARKNNLGVPIPDRVPLDGVHVFATFEELVADPEVELIVVSSLTGAHRWQSELALKHGKHVLVEKPIAPAVEDAKAMIAAARAAGKKLFCGQILPWFADFDYAMQRILEAKNPDAAVDARLHSLQLYRHINYNNPTTRPESLAETGGPVIDLFIHDAHFIASGFGPPKCLSATGTVRDGVVTAVRVYPYYEGTVGQHPHIVIDCGAVLHGDNQFRHGAALGFERSSFTFGSDGPAPTRWLFDEGRAVEVIIPGRTALDAFTAQLTHALDRIEGIAPDDGPLSATAAAAALRICFAAKESVMRGGAIVEVGAE